MSDKTQYPETLMGIQFVASVIIGTAAGTWIAHYAGVKFPDSFVAGTFAGSWMIGFPIDFISMAIVAKMRNYY